MTQKHDMTTPKMTRVAVRVPTSTLDQINAWVDTLGVRRSHFLGIALVSGVRSLVRASALEILPGAAPADKEGGLEDPVSETTESHSASVDRLTEEVRALKAENARLQAELAALRE